MRLMHPRLKAMIPVADAIQATAGIYCEVVLHDIKYPECSVVYVAGNVTNRQIGAPLTDLVLERLRRYGEDVTDILSYDTTTREGKHLRSSTTFIRDDENQIIGCLCINTDLTPMISWKYFLERSLYTDANRVVKESVVEHFAQDVSEALSSIIASVTESYTYPLASLPREEKLSLIGQLDNKGVFMVKGAVDLVASTLGVSRYSVYNYLEEVRNQKN